MHPHLLTIMHGIKPPSSISTCRNISLLYFLPLISFCINFHFSYSQETWVRAGYWYSGAELPVSSIDSSLFTHLFCSFAFINSSSYQLYINSTDQQSFSTFTTTVRSKNPSVVSLLSIWVGREWLSDSSLLVNEFSHRRSFIESSIKTARLYGFDGLDLSGIVPSSSINMTSLGTLFEEWREAVNSESRNASKTELLLVMAGYYLPTRHSVSYPIDSIKTNLNWVHIVAFDYYLPTRDNFTGAHSALYAPSSQANTNSGIKEWLKTGLPSSKLVLGLPYHGYAWRLVNPNDNGVGAPASGPAIMIDGSIGYKTIKSFIQNYGYGAKAVYNSTYVANFFSVGSNWINFDDVEAIKAKVAYAKENKLRGYIVFQLSNDDNWVLSQAAQGNNDNKQNNVHVFVPIVVTIALTLLLIGAMMYCYFQRKVLKSKGIIIGSIRRSLSTMNADAPNLQAFSFKAIKAATNNFSSENKLGEGGFGPVYKGKLLNGRDVAVKRLSKTSNQGAEEFENEVTLTARLQHVNLVRVVGFCAEKEEKMLIYEYMPNKSLDFYLYDPVKRYILDWRKRVHIIEGITQGLLYLQEYSNFTVIHRDIKVSNILLDEEMNPKIADFGMARLFRKDETEANTDRIVGTYGYVPPEYVRKGIYSMKYDVYSFGVLLLQIISGKRTACYYGSNENLNLLDYAYDLWKDGEGKEFIDPSIDDSSSTCKVMRCMQVGLLCVQENPMDRPSMLEVWLMLRNESATVGAPKRPAFSVKRDEDDKECVSRDQIYSVDDRTISQVVPR